VTTAGVVTEFPTPTGSNPSYIGAGPDGNVWYTDLNVPRIGMVTPEGVVTEYPYSGIGLGGGIAGGPDGNVWFAAAGTGAVVKVRITPDPTGEFTPLVPTRILDTRTSLGGHPGKLGPGQSLSQQITGQGGVPAHGVGSVVVNVSVTEPTAPSHLTVWPSGNPMPLSSNLNYVPGQTVPNLVTVGLGADGAVLVYNNAGSTHVIVDVVGYYAGATGNLGSRFRGLDPTRLFDTRNGSGGVPDASLTSGQILAFEVTGKGGVPATGVTSVVMNVTVTEPTSSGFVTVYPDGGATPTASNLNFVAGLTAPNLVVVKVPASGVVDFYHFSNFGGRTHLLADVVGYYDDDRSTEAGRFVPILPVRAFDTRVSSPWPAPGCIPGGSGISQTISNTNIDSIMVNVTVTEPTASGHVTVFPAPPPQPLASNLNFVPGQTVPNQVIAKLGEGGAVLYYNSAGCTHLIADVFGFFTSATAPPPSPPSAVGEAADGASALDTEAAVTPEPIERLDGAPSG
jgi:hypothetical protein